MTITFPLRRAATLLGLLIAACCTHAQTTWQSVGSLPTARAQAAAATDGTSIYVFGGWNNSSAFNSVDIFNPATNSWTSGPAMPTAIRGASALYLNNSIYVVGGWNDSLGGQQNIIQILNLATNTWSSVNVPTAGWETSAVAVGGLLYTIGGETDKFRNFTFNPSTSLTSDFASSPNGSLASQAFVFNNSIYLVGAGSTYDRSALVVDVYDIATNTWSTAPADQALPRTQFAGGSNGSHIFIAGGSDSATNGASPFYSSFSIYDTASDTWSAGPDLPVGLREATGVVFNETFYVLGGLSSSGLNSTLYAIHAVPEPSTVALAALGLGWIALGLWRRRH